MLNDRVRTRRRPRDIRTTRNINNHLPSRKQVINNVAMNRLTNTKIMFNVRRNSGTIKVFRITVRSGIRILRGLYQEVTIRRLHPRRPPRRNRGWPN